MTFQKCRGWLRLNCVLQAHGNLGESGGMLPKKFKIIFAAFLKKGFFLLLNYKCATCTITFKKNLGGKSSPGGGKTPPPLNATSFQ